MKIRLPACNPVLIILLIALVVAGAGLPMKVPGQEQNIEEIFHLQMKDIILKVNGFSGAVHHHEPVGSLKEHFKVCRAAYKKAAVVLDYFFPYEWKLINGPDVKKAEEDNPDVVVVPKGFQVMERILCSSFNDTAYSALEKETDDLLRLLEGIEGQKEGADKFRNKLIFDALRSADIRLMTQGITGFDSPLMLNSISEAKSTLEGMNEILSAYAGKLQSAQYGPCQELIKGAIHFLATQKNFNSFDRLGFIRQYADPVFSQLGEIAADEGFLLPEERRPFNQLSKSIFDKDAFDINYFSPNNRYQATDKRKYLGSLLFADTIFSLTAKRSCASCHHPETAFSDGLTAPLDLRGNRLKRNTPTLLNAALQTRYFYDSRTSTLENQLNAVVHNTDEMNGSLKASIPAIEANKRYAALFREAYPSDKNPVTEYNIANAISSYVRSLTALNSRFDRSMRGEKVDFTKAERHGFNLFAGKAKCATCHYLPLFNGLVPPQFTETESEVIGVPATGGSLSTRLDSDSGKFLFTRSAADLFAFKTPSLRNIALTAPYMHNGVFKTLSEVMDFYNKGGGAGWHIAPENETLPAAPLLLSKKEVRDIIAFLHTLTDSGYPVPLR